MLTAVANPGSHPQGLNYGERQPEAPRNHAPTCHRSWPWPTVALDCDQILRWLEAQWHRAHLEPSERAHKRRHHSLLGRGVGGGDWLALWGWRRAIGSTDRKLQTLIQLYGDRPLSKTHPPLTVGPNAARIRLPDGSIVGDLGSGIRIRPPTFS